MLRLLSIALTATLIVASSSCRTDPEVPATPAVSFQTQVQVILSSNCNMSGCHATSGGEFPLTTYEDVMRYVSAGDARGSELYKVITGRGEERMPPDGRDPLTDDEIVTLYVWIQQGAKNN